jgi:hypothetical protein
MSEQNETLRALYADTVKIHPGQVEAFLKAFRSAPGPGFADAARAGLEAVQWALLCPDPDTGPTATDPVHPAAAGGSRGGSCATPTTNLSWQSSSGAWLSYCQFCRLVIHSPRGGWVHLDTDRSMCGERTSTDARAEAEHLEHSDLPPNADDRMFVKAGNGAQAWTLGWTDPPELPEEREDPSDG